MKKVNSYFFESVILKVFITAVGLAVGLSVGLFFLGLFILISVLAVLFFLWQGI